MLIKGKKVCFLGDGITEGYGTTELLSNKINHPSREMNWLFAYSLVETMFEK